MRVVWLPRHCRRSRLSADADGMVGSDSLTRCWLTYVLPSLERLPPDVGELPLATRKLGNVISTLLGERLPNVMLQHGCSIDRHPIVPHNMQDVCLRSKAKTLVITRAENETHLNYYLPRLHP